LPLNRLLIQVSKKAESQSCSIHTQLNMHVVKLLDLVALICDSPEQGLLRGQVGTIVENLAPGVFEVELSDDEGHAYAQLALKESQLLLHHFQPQRAA